MLAIVLAAASPALATTLHSGDKIQVTVYNHPDLSGPVTLDAAGRISMPLAGEIQAADVDTAGVAGRIRVALMRYIPKAAVDVQLVGQNQSIFVAGGPGGTLAYVPGETLSTALAQLQLQAAPQSNIVVSPANKAARDLLGGRVDLRKVSVERDGSTLGAFDAAKLTATGEAGPLLYPGDTVHLVVKPVRVRVVGEVAEPGFAYLDESEPESNALAQVGGALPTASLSNIAVTRNGSEQQAALGRRLFAEPAQNGDTVIVPRAPTVGVVGAMEHPGQTTLRGTPNLISALYEAGGPAQKADIKHVAVIHDGTRTEYDVTGVTHGTDPSQSNPMLVDGDSVIVPIGHKLDLNSLWQAVIGARLLFP